MNRSANSIIPSAADQKRNSMILSSMKLAFYQIEQGFSTWDNGGYSKKGIDPGGNTHSDLTIWDVNLISEYGYEFTESGGPLSYWELKPIMAI